MILSCYHNIVVSYCLLKVLTYSSRTASVVCMWFWCSLKQCSRRLSIEICPPPAHSMTLILIRLSVQWLIHRQRGSVTNRSNCLWFRNLLPTEFYERFASSRVKSGSPKCATWATKDVVVIVTEVCLPEITRRIVHESIRVGPLWAVSGCTANLMHRSGGGRRTSNLFLTATSAWSFWLVLMLARTKSPPLLARQYSLSL